MKKAIIIQGPTASGKTAVAVRLAAKLHTGVVSADSRQCYDGMPIGTAWPSVAELSAAPHYFIGGYPVTTALTAADYEQIALKHLSDLFLTSDNAVVCGGTGLYIKALCEGLDAMPAVDEEIEKAVNDGYKNEGVAWLQEAIRAEDPTFFATGEIANPARLIRALVFVRSTGKSILTFRTRTTRQRPFGIIKIGLELPREELYERINQRVDIMLQQGLEQEVLSLFPQRHLKNLQTVGYSELFEYIEGKCTYDYAVDKIKQHTRNYAKRQLTWFKKDPEIHWLTTNDKDIDDKIMQLIQ